MFIIYTSSCIVVFQSAIQAVFSLSGPHRSVKVQLCQLAKTVVDSIGQIANIFCTQQNGETTV